MGKAEADVVVAIRRAVAIAIRRRAVRAVVVPATTTQHSARAASGRLPHLFTYMQKSKNLIFYIYDTTL